MRSNRNAQNKPESQSVCSAPTIPINLDKPHSQRMSVSRPDQINVCCSASDSAFAFLKFRSGSERRSSPAALACRSELRFGATQTSDPAAVSRRGRYFFFRGGVGVGSLVGVSQQGTFSILPLALHL